jgi:hypothetical protein
MKVKIIKKTIKEGDNYCIKSLYVCVDNREDANKLAKMAIEVGATPEDITKLIRKSDRSENEFAFGLNCSSFTFDKVDRFGILDCEIEYTKNAKGYISAKIHVLDKKEQVNGYSPAEEEVNGWANAEAEKSVSVPIPENISQPTPSVPIFSEPQEAGNDLPF